MLIKIGHLNNPAWSSAMNKLDLFTGWDKQTMYNFNKLRSKCDHEQKKGENSYNQIVKDYAQFEPIMVPDGKGNLTAKRNQATGNIITKPKYVMRDQTPTLALKDKDGFNKAFKDLMDTEFEVKIFPFDAEVLISAGLTPAEIRACAYILKDAPAEWHHPEVPETDPTKEDPTAVDPNSKIKGAVAAPPPPPNGNLSL